MRSLFVIGVVAFGLAACNQTRKDCEHARDVFVEMAQEQFDLAMKDASPEEVAKYEARGKAEIAQVEQAFVGHCEALDEAGLACIARIDELKQADADRRKAVDACPKDDLGLPDTSCRKEAAEAADAKVGSCKETVRNLAAAVYASAPTPDPAAKD